MPKTAVNYIVAEFRVETEQVNENALDSLIDIQSAAAYGIQKEIRRTHGQEDYILKLRAEGESKWDQAMKFLNYLLLHKSSIEKLKSNHDIFFGITIVCNIRRMKNPVPIELKEKMQELGFFRTFLNSISKAM